MPPRKRIANPTTAITYCRVSTEEQRDSGLGLDAQWDKVSAEVSRREWENVGNFADEGLSAKSITDRPQLLAALDVLDTGQAANLVVAKLDRLSRSVHDFTGMMERAQRRGWKLVVLDLGIDTTTPTGEMMANIMATFAQFERRLIGERTSAALQVLKRNGATLGRPERIEQRTVNLICALRQQGRTLQYIADWLMLAGIRPAQDAVTWYPSTVKLALERRIEGVL